MLEAAAMHAPLLEFCLDPGQVLEQYHFSKTWNAFRARVILGAANRAFDYDYDGPRIFRLATIADPDNPHNPGVDVFGNQQEYDASVEACHSAAETGWAVHVANGCEQNYLQRMRTHIVNRAPDYEVRSLTDHFLWYKDHLTEQAISTAYQHEIRIMEAVRGDVITFLQGIIDIGAERRALSTFLQHPYTFKRDLPAITRFRSEQTGRPDPFSDVFSLFQDEPTRSCIWLCAH